MNEEQGECRSNFEAATLAYAMVSSCHTHGNRQASVRAGLRVRFVTFLSTLCAESGSLQCAARYIVLATVVEPTAQGALKSFKKDETEKVTLQSVRAGTGKPPQVAKEEPKPVMLSCVTHESKSWNLIPRRVSLTRDPLCSAAFYR